MEYNTILYLFNSMKRILATWIVCLCWGALYATPLVPFNVTLLEQLKAGYLKGDKQVVHYIDFFEKVADKYIKMSPLSVTSKKKLPPSKDPRDYMTLSPYWWPDSTKTDGLPYIRRDGQRNPEVYEYPERENANCLGDATICLGVLYYITGKEIYAKTCANFLRTWFTDPKFGMNPNMIYAQYVPGMKTIRGSGFIDSRRFCHALSAAKLINGSANWSDSDKKKLSDWATAFCYWMENSTQGQKESHATNNHGLWYETIHLMVLAYLDRTDRIKEVTEQSILPKIGAQVADDGSLPQELKRTLSLHYSTFVLEALTEANQITSQIGINLWETPALNKKKISQAVAYLYPYYLNPEKWKYKQIKPFNQSRAAIVLYEAGIALNNQRYLDAAKKIGLKYSSSDIETMLYLVLKKE